MPEVSCYIVTTTIAAPALVIMGVPEMAAHFFAFYFGTMSAVIPPVALTSFTAASIAQDNPNKTALTALALGSAGLLLPHIFIYNKVLLFIEFTWINYICSFACTAVGLYAMSVAVIGVLKVRVHTLERIAFFAVAVLLIFPTFHTRMAGVILFGLSYILHKRRAKNVTR